METFSEGFIKLMVEGKGNNRCACKLNGIDTVVHLSPLWMEQVVPGCYITIRDFRVEWHEEGLHWHPNEKSILILHPSPKRGDMCAAEMFGGIGGWTDGSHHFGIQTALIVEKDVVTAQACAAKYNVPCMTAKQYVDEYLKGNRYSKCVLADDVGSVDTWVAVGLANANMIMGSPPCQPWSGSGVGRGLQSEDGKIFKDLISRAALVGIQWMLLENVPGFPKHGDFETLVSHAAVHGLKLALSGIHQCSTIMPIKRERWLGTFVHSSIHIDAEKAKEAKSLVFGGQSVVLSPTVSQSDVIHCNMSQDERNQLQIPEDAVNKMSKPEFAPGWLKSISTNEDYLQGRIVDVTKQFVGFMASYGMQHELPHDQLLRKGLQTSFFRDEIGDRYFSPWEMISALGYVDSTVLPLNIREAWKIAGNGISVAHVTLQLYKTFVMLGPESPFTPKDEWESIQKKCQVDMIKLSKYETVREDWWKLQKSHEHESKRVRHDDYMGITPTVPITGLDEDDFEMQKFEKAPVFHHPDDPRRVASTCGWGGIVVLKHENKNWMIAINTKTETLLSAVITQGLPHAKPVQFVKFEVEGKEIQWDDCILCNPVCRVTFSPMTSRLTICEESLKICFSMMIDTTWTVKTALAICSYKIGCNIDSINMEYQGLTLKDEDFLVEYETSQMDLKFKAVLPGYVSWAPSALTPKDPGMAPAPTSFKRWVARHPVNKVLRTCAFDRQTKIIDIVRVLFPDVHATVPWKVYHKEREMQNQEIMPEGEVGIQWEGFRPLRVSTIHQCNAASSVISDQFQKAARDTYASVWIRSPFKVKPEYVKVPRSWTLMEVGASFFAQSQVNTSVICMDGSQVIDPDLLVDQFSKHGIMSFRMCPLLGGAKHDGVKSRLKKMLSEKGVPPNVVDDRVNGYVAKVNLERFKGCDSDEKFWEKAKELANESHYRMILPAEFKGHQKHQRRDKIPRTSDSNNAGGGRAKQCSPKAAEMVINPCHFLDDGKSVKLLEVGRVGPDQAGLVIVSADEARKCLQMGLKSPDALALLVVDENLNGLGESFTLPAHLKDGTPVIVKAVLIQCGDRPVTYAASVPSIIVDQLEATTIEFIIVRDHVSNWSDTAVPLHYIGIHVPALRGSNLLSTWSIKAWGEGKKPIHYSNANHWHGYFRIQDDLLGSVLSRSGAAGIFMNPKTQDKRHDHRFATVAIPGQSLQEVIAKAEQCKHSVGIAKMGAQFAIRCKREHLSAVRQFVMPESAFVETATFSEDKELYVLKNVPQVGRDELSKALGQAGWKAEAVKAQGMNRWLVAAQSPPPASHLVINKSLTIIEKLQRNVEMTPFTMVAKEYSVNTIVDHQQNVVQVSTTSRIAEIKAEMETRIAETVEKRMSEANSKIEKLTQALQQVQDSTEQSQANMAAELCSMKEEQTFTKQKLVDVETTVAASSQGIINQMQQMFAKMQDSLEANIAQTLRKHDVDVEGGDKRPRRE